MVFGWLQCRLLSIIIGRQGRVRYSLLPVKLFLWAGTMVLLAMWSVPVLICFVLGATGAMLASVPGMRRRAKEE